MSSICRTDCTLPTKLSNNPDPCGDEVTTAADGMSELRRDELDKREREIALFLRDLLLLIELPSRPYPEPGAESKNDGLGDFERK